MPLSANAIISLAEAKAYCRRKFIQAAIASEILDGEEDCDQVFLEFAPIVSLTSVKFDSVSQDISSFKIDKVAGRLKYDAGIFPEGFQNIEVAYLAGYGAAIANMPEDIKIATKKQVEFFWKRDSADFSDTFDEGMIIRAPGEMLSPAVRDILSTYFRTRII